MQQAWPTNIAKAEIVDNSRKKPAPRCSGARTKPGRNGYKHRQQYGIVVICDNEQAQERAYARLQRGGFKKLRVVTV